MGKYLLCLLVFWALALIWALGRAAGKLPKRDFRGWEGAARELELPFAGRENEHTLGGLLVDVPVRATFQRKLVNTGTTRGVQETTTFYAGGIARIPKSLVVHKDMPLRSFSRLFGGRDEPTGDESFDDLMELPGLDAYACAALSRPARRQLAVLVKRGGEVRASTLTHALENSGPELQQAFLVQTFRFFAHLARLLTVTPASLHQRLADNSLQDPSAGVRLRNFRFLADPAIATPAALLLPVARTLLMDAHLPLRLRAARVLGREGSPVLQALASDGAVELDLRLDALAALREQADPALTELIPKLLSASSPPELVCSALSAVAGLPPNRGAGLPPNRGAGLPLNAAAALPLNIVAAAVLACTRHTEPTIRAAAARALAGLEAHPEDEAVRVGLLADPSADVQLASADALGAVGSVTGVEPLLPVAQGFGHAPLRRSPPT